MRPCLRLSLRLLVISLCSVPLTALGQLETATMTGTVRDATGAVVSKAVVTVTNTRTNIVAKTETDDRGLYTVPSLRPGDYSVTVESAGFSKVVRTGVTLQVAQVAAIDVTLQPGAVSETVDVVGATSLLDTQTSSRGVVIDQKQIVELPLNGRDYTQLPLLAPGVLPSSTAGERGLQGGDQRQRQPRLQQCLSARRRGQHLVFEFVPGRERTTSPAVHRGAAGIQDPDKRVFG